MSLRRVIAVGVACSLWQFVACLNTASHALLSSCTASVSDAVTSTTVCCADEAADIRSRMNTTDPVF